MNEMTNEQTDTALILENELKRRVREVVRGIVGDVVSEQMAKKFAEQKAEMLLEVCIAVGKNLQTIENEGRKPLWESTPEEFGLTSEELNRSSIRRLDDIPQEVFKDAIRKQT